MVVNEYAWTSAQGNAQPGRNLVLQLAGQSHSGASFTSVAQLRQHIDAFIETYNVDTSPFVWTKSHVHQKRFKGRRVSQL
jgi:hypothetical protein